MKKLFGRTRSRITITVLMLVLAGVGPVRLAQSQSTASGGPDRPNIILFLSDDHSTRTLSAYGSELAETPHLDRLANEGMLFQSAYVTESICKPSRGAFLTGKYGHVTGGTGWSVYNKSEHKSFPEYLREAGYRTALFGKYHLGRPIPGFDDYAVLQGQGSYFDPTLIHKERGRTSYDGHISDVIADLSIDWIKKQQAGDDPYLICIQDKSAHMPFLPPKRLAEKYRDRRMPEPDTLFFPSTHPDWPGSRSALLVSNLMRWMEPYWTDLPSSPQGNKKEYTRQVYQTFIKEYVRTIEGMDQNIGRVMRFLEEQGALENTVVIYTSDQGFLLGEHGLFDKRFMYEPSSQIPFIIRYPDMVEPGARRDELILNIDLAPTLLDLANLEVPDDMQGRSLRPLLSGQPADDWRDAIYYRLHAPAYRVVPHYGIRTNRYKLIHFEGRGKPRGGDRGPTEKMDTWKLFDLQNDPQETNNLYGNPEHQHLVDRLKTKLYELRKKYGDPKQ